MVNIEINGIPLQVRDGAMVIEAADESGITIPRFCYHKKLSIAANCRMCLVEVEKVGKPLPACATPVTEGMKVFTKSPRAIAAQKGVMEFLLINHPLDCPICDQGGECDLQEMAMGYGEDVSQYSESKRVVPSKDIGPLVATDMTRCIHCTRCVRFGQEVAGVMEMGAPGRGEFTRIGLYVENTVDSELSTNMADLCPVGALTAKPSRYTARPWELSGHDSVSPHDCVGANLRIDTRSHQVMRVVPRENDEVNETWIADRDRFSYQALSHDERLTQPMIKKEGRWEATDWDTALTMAAGALKTVVHEHGANQIGALAGYSATVEELYLLQKLMRGVGSHNIDHRLRQQEFSGQDRLPAFPFLGQAIADLENQEAVLLVGSNVRKDQPLIAQRLRKAANNGAKISTINPMAYDLAMEQSNSLTVTPAAMMQTLAGVAQALLDAGVGDAPEGLAALVKGASVSDEHRAIAAELKSADRAAVLVGNLVAGHAEQSHLQALASAIAQLSGARFGFLPEGGNSAGAWLAGAVPHRLAGGVTDDNAGLDWRAMMDARLKGFVLLNTEPEMDCVDAAAMQATLQAADTVVSLTPFVTDTMREYADVMLPISLFPETSGSLINVEGRWQSFAGAAKPQGDARPAWKILRVMGNLFDVAGFDYLSSEEVRDEMQQACSAVIPSSDLQWHCPAQLNGAASGITLISDHPIYAADSMVRRSEALQQTRDAIATAIYLSAASRQALGLGDAEQATLRCNGQSLSLPVVEDERIPEQCIYVPLGQAAVGSMGSPVELERA